MQITLERMTLVTALIITFCSVMVTRSPAIAADYVVMERDGDTTFEIGDIVDGTEPVALPDSSSLTLVSSSGEKIRVEGPFVGALGGVGDSASGQASVPMRSLANLFRAQAEWAATHRLVRSLGEEPNADPWIFDIEWDSAYCYRNPGDAALWRRKAVSDGAVEITVSGDRVATNWPKGANKLEWPADMPISVGDQYSIRVDKDDKRLIEFKKLPKDLPTRAHMAGWMADNACDDQAVLLMLSAEIDWMLSGLVKSGEF